MQGFGVLRRRARSIALLPLAALVVVLAACSAGGGDVPKKAPPAATTGTGVEAELIAAAQKNGSAMTLYTSVDPATADTLAKTFEEKYGIKVAVTRLVSGPIVARYSAEASSGDPVADLMIVANRPFFEDGLAKGWFLPMTADQIPNIDKVPKTFQYDGSVGVGTSRLNGLVANTGLVSKSDTPTTWEDLLEPKFKGKLVGNDPRTIPVVLNQWVALDKKLGDGYLKKIAQQNVSWAPSLVAGVQEVAAGEKLVAFGINQGHVNPLLATAPTAPVTQPIVLLKPVDLGFAWNAGVSAKSPNPAAARLFINWLLTNDGQKLFNGATLSPSVLPGVEIPGAAKLGPDFLDVGGSTSESEKARILSLLGLDK